MFPARRATIDQRTRQNIQVPICDLASSHMARRTFIGNVYKSVKDPAIVGAMSGHKDGPRFCPLSGYRYGY